MGTAPLHLALIPKALSILAAWAVCSFLFDYPNRALHHLRYRDAGPPRCPVGLGSLVLGLFWGFGFVVDLTTHIGTFVGLAVLGSIAIAFVDNLRRRSAGAPGTDPDAALLELASRLAAEAGYGSVSCHVLHDVSRRFRGSGVVMPLAYAESALPSELAAVIARQLYFEAGYPRLLADWFTYVAIAVLGLVVPFCFWGVFGYWGWLIAPASLLGSWVLVIRRLRAVEAEADAWAVDLISDPESYLSAITKADRLVPRTKSLWGWCFRPIPLAQRLEAIRVRERAPAPPARLLRP